MTPIPHWQSMISLIIDLESGAGINMTTPSLFCFHVCSKGSNANPKYVVSVLVQVVSDRVSAVPDGSEQVNSATWARPSKYGTMAADGLGRWFNRPVPVSERPILHYQYQYQKD